MIQEKTDFLEEWYGNLYLFINILKKKQNDGLFKGEGTTYGKPKK